ncbi:MAG: DUF1295 domain-containing protein [Planctomycetes bacterium]|nr:DUF1295 domain-containing protein [Planctomycetota bacterium]
MLGAWAVQRRTRNAGIVDLVWAAGIGMSGVAYAVFATGWLPRRILVGALAGLWSFRLVTHLAARLRRESEDGRYADLRVRLGARFDAWMLVFFQAQALLAVLLSLALLVPAAATETGFGMRDGAAVLLWITALVGEGIADKQLRAWRADPANKGRTCRSGLWRYSRHPNYFFEWIHWLAYPVLAIGLPWGWAVWLAPLVMLVLVVKVTGIPPTEAQSLRSRGADYRAYQQSTNAFFPWFPRVVDSSDKSARNLSASL